MKVCTAEQMRAIDAESINKYGILGILLMERAALSCCDVIERYYPDGNIAIICGSGNNGGDGFAIARILHNKGRQVTCYHLTDLTKVKGDALIHLQIAQKSGVSIKPISEFFINKSGYQLIVDAIFGTGLNKEVTSIFEDSIKVVNSLNIPIIAVDIPSGISADTGRILGIAIKASETVTFGLPKRGHFMHPGKEYTGRLHVVDIGLPHSLLHTDEINVSLFQKAMAKHILPKRPDDSYKNTYGHALIIGGSQNMVGAVLMTAKACMRTGAGLCTIAAPLSSLPSIQAKIIEEMTLPLSQDSNGIISALPFDELTRYDALAIGMGMGVTTRTQSIMQTLIAEFTKPMVIDADAINSLAGDLSSLSKTKSTSVLTPHHAEFARLVGKTVSEVKSDRIASALDFAVKYNAVLVLKGNPTIIAAPDGRCVINTSGNAGMATAGAGDVLTGMIAGLLAQGVNPFDAACLAVYLHGKAGDISASRLGIHSMIASDIINSISEAIQDVLIC